MARDPVAQVDAPGQRGRRPIGPVWQAGEQTTETADNDAQRERPNENTAGRAAYAFDRLVNLHPHNRPDEGAGHAMGERWPRIGEGVDRPRDPGADRRAERQG